MCQPEGTYWVRRCRTRRQKDTSAPLRRGKLGTDVMLKRNGQSTQRANEGRYASENSSQCSILASIYCKSDKAVHSETWRAAAVIPGRREEALLSTASLVRTGRAELSRSGTRGSPGSGVRHFGLGVTRGYFKPTS